MHSSCTSNFSRDARRSACQQAALFSWKVQKTLCEPLARSIRFAVLQQLVLHPSFRGPRFRDFELLQSCACTIRDAHRYFLSFRIFSIALYCRLLAFSVLAPSKAPTYSPQLLFGTYPHYPSTVLLPSEHPARVSRKRANTLCAIAAHRFSHGGGVSGRSLAYL